MRPRYDSPENVRKQAEHEAGCDGKHPVVAGGAIFLTLLGGLAILPSRRADTPGPDWIHYGVSTVGLVILSSGINTGVQMRIALAQSSPTLAALVTLGFVIVAIVSGGCSRSALGSRGHRRDVVRPDSLWQA